MTDRRVDVYPVGVLAHLRHACRYLTLPTSQFPHAASPPVTVRWRISRAQIELRYIRQSISRHITRRQWRELRQSFNGYLAEPSPWPQDGSLTRCGSGWTKTRALRSLRRHGYREDTTL